MIKGLHQHKPIHSTTPATSTWDMPFSDVATPSQQHIPSSASPCIPVSQFTNTVNAGPSSYVPHIPPQSSRYDLDPSFFTTPSNTFQVLHLHAYQCHNLLILATLVLHLMFHTFHHNLQGMIWTHHSLPHHHNIHHIPTAQ